MTAKLALALLVPVAAAAAEVAAPPAAPAAAIVLKAARLFDGVANAVTTPGILVVADGKITGVGPAAAIPTGARVIDLGDATLLPGLIDAHTHMSFAERLGLPGIRREEDRNLAVRSASTCYRSDA